MNVPKKIITKQGFKILNAANTVEPLSADDRAVFNKLWIFPGKGPVADGVLTANAGDVAIGEFGVGDKVCTDTLTPGGIPVAIILPDGCFKKLSEVLIRGDNAGDGVFFKYWEP